MTKKPYVLVVEDDEWLAQQHVRTLEAAGMRAQYVLNALAAMDQLDVTQPDVLVLDVLLPGPNAFTLLHEVHSHSDLMAMPIVLCTNSADRLRQEDLMIYGVVRVLDKTTMHPSDLVAAVRKVLL